MTEGKAAVQVGSPIEAMIGRPLEREKRAGVVHFKTGQLGVRRFVEAEDADDCWELSIVDALGNAWLILCDYGPEGWDPVMAFRGAQTVIGHRPPPELRPEWVEALNRARADFAHVA